jgi:hypothetical protein
MTIPAVLHKRIPPRLFVAAFVVLPILCVVDTATHWSDLKPNPALREATDPLNAQQAIGRALRVAIDSTYRQARAEERNVSAADLTALVERFIPLGSPVSDGESVLRHAGLEVRRVVQDRRAGVFASTDYASLLVCGTRLLVTLYPTSDGPVTDVSAVHWDAIAKVSASFFTICL